MQPDEESYMSEILHVRVYYAGVNLGGWGRMVMQYSVNHSKFHQNHVSSHLMFQKFPGERHAPSSP